MNANYDGEPIDMTYQHISERDGETVAGSTGGSNGTEQTTFWPSVLPDDVFSDWEKDALRRLSYHNDVQSVAEAVGKSDSSVNKALQKASVFAAPEDVPFPIPDKPTWDSLSCRDHRAARTFDDSDGEEDDEIQSQVSKKSLPDSKVDEIRQALLDGTYTKNEFLKRHDMASGHYHTPLAEMLESAEYGAETPPVTWDQSSRQWIRNTKKKMVSFRFSQDTEEDVQEYADVQGISKSEAFRRLVRSGLESERSDTQHDSTAGKEATASDSVRWMVALGGFLCGVFLSVLFGLRGGSGE